LWDAETGAEVFTLRGHVASVFHLTFSPDGHRLATSDMGTTARLWDATPLPPERMGPSTGTADRRAEAPRAAATADPATDPEYRKALAARHMDLALLLATDPRSRDTARAVELAKKAVELEPKLGSFWLRLGLVHALSGDRPAAEQAFRKAEDLGPLSPLVQNHVAWFLARYPDARFRGPGRAVELARKAVELARKAVELAPKQGMFWNTLGVAQYRAGEWKAAIAALEKSESLAPDKHLAFNGFFLAMAHWQLGHKDEARAWYDRAVAWTDKYRVNDEELMHFRAEAEELMKEVPGKRPDRP
jgi:Flp pilus assembly protein TadD